MKFHIISIAFIFTTIFSAKRKKPSQIKFRCNYSDLLSNTVFDVKYPGKSNVKVRFALFPENNKIACTICKQKYRCLTYYNNKSLKSTNYNQVVCGKCWKNKATLQGYKVKILKTYVSSIKKHLFIHSRNQEFRNYGCCEFILDIKKPGKRKNTVKKNSKALSSEKKPRKTFIRSKKGNTDSISVCSDSDDPSFKRLKLLPSNINKKVYRRSVSREEAKKVVSFLHKNVKSDNSKATQAFIPLKGWYENQNSMEFGVRFLEKEYTKDELCYTITPLKNFNFITMKSNDILIESMDLYFIKLNEENNDSNVIELVLSVSDFNLSTTSLDLKKFLSEKFISNLKDINTQLTFQFCLDFIEEDNHLKYKLKIIVERNLKNTISKECCIDLFIKLLVGCYYLGNKMDDLHKFYYAGESNSALKDYISDPYFRINDWINASVKTVGFKFLNTDDDPNFQVSADLLNDIFKERLFFGLKQVEENAHNISCQTTKTVILIISVPERTRIGEVFIVLEKFFTSKFLLIKCIAKIDEKNGVKIIRGVFDVPYHKLDFSFADFCDLYDGFSYYYENCSAIAHLIIKKENNNNLFEFKRKSYEDLYEKTPSSENTLLWPKHLGHQHFLDHTRIGALPLTN